MQRLSVPTVSHPALKALPEQLIRCLHLLRQTFQGFLLQLGRHSVKGFGNAAGDAGKGVAALQKRPGSLQQEPGRFTILFQGAEVQPA